ncbi:MAG: hypothetical protein ABSD56_01145 [Bryobacteraceae bacterium]
MATKIKVVLFEDTVETQAKVLKALTKHLKPHGLVIPFQARRLTETPSDRERTYEARLTDILTRPPYHGATLIVADQNLAKSPTFLGLSVGAVAAVSKTLAIPLCEYACLPVAEDYEWRRQWEKGRIALRFRGEDDIGRRAALAARGFAKIAAQLPRFMPDSADVSPGMVLAALLGKPEYSGKITLYGVGEERLSEVPAKARQAAQQVRRMTHFLGYWLWDSLLRYPGLLVNQVAAASYLNIETAGFGKPTVQEVFKKALYRGPFADTERPQWWRGMLDDIVSGEDCADGLELVRKKVRSRIERSRCCVDPSKRAGYYCIISRQPVSLENSKGGLSWFPRGADLTRISNPMLEEYVPWLGA